MLSLFSHLFVTERHRQRAGDVGFAVPALSEVVVEGNDIEPLLASNMRGTFVQTRTSVRGHARFGFSECEPEHEGRFLCEFYRVLVETAQLGDWNNLALTLGGALDIVRGNQFSPKIAVVSSVDAGIALPEGMHQVVVEELPDGAALVFATAAQVGLYTRVGNHMGLLAYRVDRAIAAVVPQ